MYIDKNIKDNIFLRLSINYNKGGLNYFYNTQEKKGIYLQLTRVIKDGYSVKYIPTDSCNYKIRIIDLNRYSQKKHNIIYEKIKDLQDKIFNLYMTDNKTDLLDLVKNLDV